MFVWGSVLMSYYTAAAQDVVIKKDGARLQTRIIAQNADRIKYRNYKKRNQSPVYVLYFDEIARIDYDSVGFTQLPTDRRLREREKEPDTTSAPKQLEPQEPDPTDAENIPPEPARAPDKKTPYPPAPISGRIALGASFPLANYGATVTSTRFSTSQIGNATTGTGIELGAEFMIPETSLGLGVLLGAANNPYDQSGLKEFAEVALAATEDTSVRINNISSEPNSTSWLGLYLLSRDHLGPRWMYYLRAGAAYQSFVSGEFEISYEVASPNGFTSARARSTSSEAYGLSLLSGLGVEYFFETMERVRSAQPDYAMSLGLEVLFSQSYLETNVESIPRQSVNLLQLRAVLNVPLQ